MEEALRRDFSGVRVHADAESRKLNTELHAAAFTTGSDIFVRPELYDPASRQGRQLLAHEVTHVAQQALSPATPLVQRKACYVPEQDSPYTNLTEKFTFSKAGKDFTEGQINDIHKENKSGSSSNSKLKLSYQSDLSTASLIRTKEVNDRLTNIDHIYPKEKDGGNLYRNAQVLSAKENNAKGQTYPWPTQPGYTGTKIFIVQKSSDVALDRGVELSVSGSGAFAEVMFPQGTKMKTATAQGIFAGKLDATQKLQNDTDISIGDARTLDLAPDKDPV